MFPIESCRIKRCYGTLHNVSEIQTLTIKTMILNIAHSLPRFLCKKKTRSLMFQSIVACNQNLHHFQNVSKQTFKHKFHKRCFHCKNTHYEALEIRAIPNLCFFIFIHMHIWSGFIVSPSVISMMILRTNACTKTQEIYFFNFNSKNNYLTYIDSVTPY